MRFLIYLASFTLLFFLTTSVLAEETRLNFSINTGGNSAENNQGNSKIEEGEISLSIKDDYIVVLNEEVTEPSKVATELESNLGIKVEYEYQKPLKGFSANIAREKLEEVKKDPRVKFISPDRLVFATSHRLSSQAVQTIPTGYNRIEASSSTNKGDGIGVAVIDTGIDLDHPDLRDNIVANVNCIRPRRNGDDDNGHGSHVAGIIAGVNNSLGTVGVAHKAKLIAVKVLNSSGVGTWSSVICGIDWVTKNAASFNIKVVNMSLGGGGVSDHNCGNSNNDALHQVICSSTNVGITYVVAAGNSSTSASTMVPAAYDDTVITVSALADSDGQPGSLGSSTSYGFDDTFANFSNYGEVVDLGAPGVSIYSAWKGGRYKIISGTSMAAPHVAAVAAIYLNQNPDVSWITVRDALKSQAEALGSGHSDPSGKHSEPVLKANNL